MRAKTSCDLLVMQKDELLLLLQSFPILCEQVKRVAFRRHSKTQIRVNTITPNKTMKKSKGKQNPIDPIDFTPQNFSKRASLLLALRNHASSRFHSQEEGIDEMLFEDIKSTAAAKSAYEEENNLEEKKNGILRVEHRDSSSYIKSGHNVKVNTVNVRKYSIDEPEQKTGKVRDSQKKDLEMELDEEFEFSG